jgi:cell division protein FtsN
VFTTLASVAFVGFLTFLSQIPADNEGAQAVRDSVKNIQIPTRESPSAETDPAQEEEPESDSPTPSLEQAFQFYKLLRDDEVPIQIAIPEPGNPSALPDDPAAGQTPNQTTNAQPQGDRWMIQVASFSRVADADRLRAELIINGLTEAHLSTVEVDNRGTFHRVMVGPFDNRSRLNRAQDILAELNHEVMVRNLN